MFTQLIDEISLAQTSEELMQICHDIAHYLECDYYLLCLFYPEGLQNTNIFLLNNYPTTWMDHYLANDLKSSDPIILHCTHKSTPALWSQIAAQNKQTKNFFGLSVDAGLVDGLSIPIRGAQGEFGVFSLARTTHIEANKKLTMLSSANFFTPYLHEAVNRNQLLERPKVKLSKREGECMKWACSGKTAWEISTILTISESTVNFHLNNAIKKTNSVNRQQAIAKVVLSGAVRPDW